MVKGKPVNFMENGEMLAQNMKRKERMSENYVMDRYSKFLEGALKSHEHTIMTTHRSFMAITYTNKMGRFAVVCQCDNQMKVQVEVFLRLGDPVSPTP